MDASVDLVNTPILRKQNPTHTFKKNADESKQLALRVRDPSSFFLYFSQQPPELPLFQSGDVSRIVGTDLKIRNWHGDFMIEFESHHSAILFDSFPVRS